MLIRLTRDFLKQMPLSILTAFKIENFTNVVKNEEKYNELKKMAIEVLNDKNKIDEYTKNFISKKIKQNSFLEIVKKGPKAFETNDALQNVINMLTILRGFTLSNIVIDNLFGKLDVYSDDKGLIFTNNNQTLGHVFNNGIENTYNFDKSILFLESMDETEYEHYLKSITITTEYLGTIFDFKPVRKILTLVSDTADTFSQAEIDWTTEGWDLFGEVALIRKKSCHI
ncbi:hypothetical protein MBVG596_1101 [Mycoplasmopsis bovigenitalium]|uniref:hypothetical protein n=1 Tax=Mycoplasmopsis bovigenitalium TaxID=2112 RepID=UPI00090C4882|nr:hypothetical protein [Mycoplasmopsis bovigenitalium]BAW18568.1 hypothetical protein MBVG596_1101 [Mycoplasmopsis bovigenitalium]